MSEVFQEQSQGSDAVSDLDPLTRMERTAALAIGVVLAAPGAVAVFISRNQAGSVTLLILGGVFMFVGVSGLAINGAKAKDWEIWFGARRRSLIERAAAAKPEQAQALLDVLAILDPAADKDPKFAELQIKILEDRVIEAAQAACGPGERYESFPDAGLGEPLIVVVTEPHGLRVGVFAAYGSGAEGHISRVSKDRFVRRARELDCAGFIFVNGMLHDDDLDYLVTGIEQDNGPVVEVETWQGPKSDTKLRPAVERVRRRVLGAAESAGGHA